MNANLDLPLPYIDLYIRIKLDFPGLVCFIQTPNCSRFRQMSNIVSSMFKFGSVFIFCRFHLNSQQIQEQNFNFNNNNNRIKEKENDYSSMSNGIMFVQMVTSCSSFACSRSLYDIIDYELMNLSHYRFHVHTIHIVQCLRVEQRRRRRRRRRRQQ